MDCNRDEALRSKEIAERRFAQQDYSGARRFALKAAQLFSPLRQDLEQFMAVLDVHEVAQQKLEAGLMDWYGILQAQPAADDASLRKQYRKLALALHPDKNKSAGADSAFKLISEAWSIFSDKKRKAAYDMKRAAAMMVAKQKPPPPPPSSATSSSSSSAASASASASSQAGKPTGSSSAMPPQAGNANNHNKAEPPCAAGRPATKRQPNSGAGSGSGRPNRSPAAARKRGDPPTSRFSDASPSSAAAAVAASSPLTFWTSCPLCHLQYEYPSLYKNRLLACPVCLKPFHARPSPFPAAATAAGTVLWTMQDQNGTRMMGAHSHNGFKDGPNVPQVKEDDKVAAANGTPNVAQPPKEEDVANASSDIPNVPQPQEVKEEAFVDHCNDEPPPQEAKDAANDIPNVPQTDYKTSSVDLSPNLSPDAQGLRNVPQEESLAADCHHHHDATATFAPDDDHLLDVPLGESHSFADCLNASLEAHAGHPKVFPSASAGHPEEDHPSVHAGHPEVCPNVPLTHAGHPEVGPSLLSTSPVLDEINRECKVERSNLGKEPSVVKTMDERVKEDQEFQAHCQNSAGRSLSFSIGTGMNSGGVGVTDSGGKTVTGAEADIEFDDLEKHGSPTHDNLQRGVSATKETRENCEGSKSEKTIDEVISEFLGKEDLLSPLDESVQQEVSCGSKPTVSCLNLICQKAQQGDLATLTQEVVQDENLFAKRSSSTGVPSVLRASASYLASICKEENVQHENLNRKRTRLSSGQGPSSRQEHVKGENATPKQATLQHEIPSAKRARVSYDQGSSSRQAHKNWNEPEAQEDNVPSVDDDIGVSESDVSGSKATTSTQAVEDVMDVPDSDFYNFDQDRAEHLFVAGQLWACYADDDGFPRYYARVHKVLSQQPFKIRYAWLEAYRPTSEVSSWLEAGFSCTCGEFKLMPLLTTKSLNMFSHLMTFERGEKGTFKIYPRKGEVWALYKEWKTVKSQDTKQGYDLVEVVTDYSDEIGVQVAALAKVEGCKSVYQCQFGQVRWILPEELLAFSHRIPVHRLTPGEVPIIYEGCLELDPASTPTE